MKNRIMVATVLLLPAAIFVYFVLHPVVEKSSSAGENKAAQDAAVAAALARQNPATVAIIASNFARVQPAPDTLGSATAGLSPAPSGPPAPLQFTNFSPAIVLENMARAVRQYGTMFGGNPVGNNPEITSQLTGNNPKHISFINAGAGMRVNENGELVDPWGTPYFFHQLSGTDMEIHSAGPDKKMWTDDDLVTR
jgi:hypothetical protein